jgi:peptidoglycan/xylan/chitin deacetylase (PgdA/CDA1 family)
MEEVQRGAPAGDWLAGASAVVLMTFELALEMPSTGGDLSVLSHDAYASRVGIPRILQLLTRLAVPATFFVPGAAAQRIPHTLEAIAMAGHEIALHGHAGTRLTAMSPAEQRADFERAVAALQALGHEPRGYRAPYWQLTRQTLELIAEAGLTYDSSLMDDDRPYRMRTAKGVIAELPVHWSLDDREQHPFSAEGAMGMQVESSPRVLEQWTAELDAMRSTRSLCVLACHPVVAGRPSRIAMLESFVGFAREKGNVRFERADHVGATVAVPRAG